MTELNRLTNDEIEYLTDMTTDLLDAIKSLCAKYGTDIVPAEIVDPLIGLEIELVYQLDARGLTILSDDAQSVVASDAFADFVNTLDFDADAGDDPAEV